MHRSVLSRGEEAADPFILLLCTYLHGCPINLITKAGLELCSESKVLLQFRCCLSSLSNVKSVLAKERLRELAGDLEPVTHVEQFSYQAEGAALQIHASHY